VRKRKDRAKVLQQRTIDAPVEGLSLSLFSSSPVLFYLKKKKKTYLLINAGQNGQMREASRQIEDKRIG
jgi:hypothetical protein